MDGYVICQRKNGFYLRKSNVSHNFNCKTIITKNQKLKFNLVF